MVESDRLPLRFIGEEIQARHDRLPVLSKKPGPPDSFLWKGETFRVVEVLLWWFDFARRGRMARNMRGAHMETAERRGSWGVGRYYYRVRVSQGRVFDLYYDRAPKEAGHRSGGWYLWRELEDPKRA